MVYQDSKMIHTPTVLARDKFRIYQPSYVSKWMTGPSCIFMHPVCSRMFSGQNIVIQSPDYSPIRTHPLFGNLRFLFSRLGRPKFGVENMSCLNLGESKPAKCPSHEILVGFFQVKTWWLSLDDHDPNWKIFKKQEKKTTQQGPFLSLLSLQMTPRKGAHLPMVSYIPWSCRVWEGCYDAAKWSLYTSH